MFFIKPHWQIQELMDFVRAKYQYHNSQSSGFWCYAIFWYLAPQMIKKTFPLALVIIASKRIIIFHIWF